MTADDHDEDQDHVYPAIPAGHRTTAPQSAYTNRTVAIGFGVLAVGLLLTFGLALALV